MTIQCIFNNQKWGDEAKRLFEVKSRLEEYSRDRLSIEILPAMYTNFTNIPFVVIPFPFTNEVGESPDPVWYKQNVYPLNRDADVLVFICKELDWMDNPSVPGRPYGYCFNQYPKTFPPFISIMAESGDKSWKFKKLNALEHYIPHELGHGLSNLTGINDLTHELDYKGKIQALYDQFDYNKINLVLKDKRKLDGDMANFYKKAGDNTVYADVQGKLVGFSTDEALLKKDWPTAKVIELTPDEFLKADQANWHTIAKRK